MGKFRPSRRDYNDPQYAKWRSSVYKRDKYICQMCGKTTQLNAHHIKMWAFYPELRFEVSNGITLCKYCHKTVTGKEEYYEAYLYQLLNKSQPISVFDVLYRKKIKQKEKEEKPKRKRKKKNG